MASGMRAESQSSHHTNLRAKAERPMVVLTFDPPSHLADGGGLGPRWRFSRTKKPFSRERHSFSDASCCPKAESLASQLHHLSKISEGTLAMENGVGSDGNR